MDQNRYNHTTCLFLTYLGIQKTFSETKSDYKDVVLFAKHFGTLFKKRKGAFMKKVDKLDALACAVRI